MAPAEKHYTGKTETVIVSGTSGKQSDSDQSDNKQSISKALEEWNKKSGRK